MKLEEKKYGWIRTGLRSRYRPKARIGGGLIATAPWIDGVLLILLVTMFASRAVLKPGLSVELPPAHASSGIRLGLAAVILSHAENGERREMIFFDDEPFAVGDGAAMRRLMRRVAQAARTHTEMPFTIEADKHVQHGTIIDLCEMARAAGFTSVDLATRQPENVAGER